MALGYYLWRWENNSSWLFISKEAENLMCSVGWTSSQLENNTQVILAKEAHEASFVFHLKHLTNPEEQRLVSGKGNKHFFLRGSRKALESEDIAGYPKY